VSVTNKQEQTWWSLFPFRGIDISNKHHDLHHPLFGDATLVSVRHLPQIIATLKLDNDPHHRPKDVIRSFEEIANRDDANTFLAIRRRVVSLFHVDGHWGDDGQQQLFNSPLVIGQSGFHRGCLPLPPALPFLHPDRKRFERPREDPRPNLPKRTTP
jgi:hypothetical protein